MDDASDQDLSSDTLLALNSLVKIDPYPLYVMTYAPNDTYTDLTPSGYLGIPHDLENNRTLHGWGCSLFTVIHDQKANLLGRNFDWSYSPALLLFYEPIDGYRSVSMVDLDYYFNLDDVQHLDELSTEDQMPLLETYRMPFDGMNESGLVIGMAAVPFSDLPTDPGRETLDSIGIIRRILDHAGNVEQAIHILNGVVPDWGRGPAIHYLISDREGRSVLVEFLEGEMVILERDRSWQIATNFLQNSTEKGPEGQCWRYDLLERELSKRSGILSREQAMELLSLVSQAEAGSRTQWSIVYDNSHGDFNIVIDQDYSNPYRFNLPMIEPQSD
jgi:hypothetical protein